jgi:hypothetical protein
MENIQKAIEQIKKELEQAEQKRQEPGKNDAARTDRDIACLNLRLQRLKDSAGTQEGTEPPADVPAYGKHFMPEEYIAIAKYHESEMIDRAMSEEGNSEGSIIVSAAARLTDMIDRTDLLRMASASPQDIPALPEEKEVAGWLCELADQDGTIQPGVLEKAWAEMCSLYRDEWRLRLKFIDAARLLAHTACDDLIAMTRQMKAVRGELQRIGKEKGSPDEIVKDNRQITTWLEIHQIPRHDNDRLSHELYRPEGEEL